MIVPSIDLAGGRCVQLVRGEDPAIDAGDPAPIAERFARVGEIAVIDLDAAKREGSNAGLVASLVRRFPCRVGGGIRDLDTARRWLDLGAERIILGTAATPDLLARLPRERLIAALDVRRSPDGSADDEVVTHGWRERSGRRLGERIAELRPYVGGFLVTFVDVEGTMAGLPLDRAVRAAELATFDPAHPCRLTVAGGVADASEIGRLDARHIDVQVGMALYTGRIGLADALVACLETDAARIGPPSEHGPLWPTVVTDEAGIALGMCYSNHASLAAALEEGRGIYWSRRRGLWRKGDDSGQTQTLLAIAADCDRDCLRFTVRQADRPGRPGLFCHRGMRTCWGHNTAGHGTGGGLHALARRLATGAVLDDPASYTARLLREPGLLGAKILEEARELVEAEDPDHTADEAADLMYFTLVRLAASGVDLERVERILDARARKVARRPGDAKPGHAPDGPHPGAENAR